MQIICDSPLDEMKKQPSSTIQMSIDLGKTDSTWLYSCRDLYKVRLQELVCKVKEHAETKNEVEFLLAEFLGAKRSRAN